MTGRVRLAEPADAAAVAAIYAPIVSGTWISFEVQVPGMDEMRGRIERATGIRRAASAKRPEKGRNPTAQT